MNSVPRNTFHGKFVKVTPPTVAQTGTTASGSAVVTGLTNTSLFEGALGVSGTGIPSNTFVSTVDSATQITLTQAATASGSTSLTFAIEPVTLAEAKRQLRITFADDDVLIANLIVAARQRCETEQDRCYLTTGWNLVIETFPMVLNDQQMWMRNQNVIVIDKGPVTTIGNITYVDAAGTTQTLTSGTDFLVRTGDPGAAAPYPVTRMWPYTRSQLDAVTVPFTAGYGTTAASVPASIKAAILILMANLYENREAVVIGTISSSLPYGLQYLLDAERWGSRP
jgi:uncharacterized phiE125 gp8 family phage protein